MDEDDNDVRVAYWGRLHVYLSRPPKQIHDELAAAHPELKIVSHWTKLDRDPDYTFGADEKD